MRTPVPRTTRNVPHQGVSRSQAIVQVCPLEGRLQVTHKQGAINGIRIIRWKGSSGLTSAQRSELRVGAPGAARSLRAGEMLQVCSVYCGVT